MTFIDTATDIKGVQFADQGSDLATPSSGFHKLESKTDGLFIINSTGTVKRVIDATGTPTKGDILVYSGSAWVRLAVGSNTQVLTANSAATNGVDWEAAGGGGGGTNPKRATMWADEFIITSGSTLIQHDTNQNYATYLQNSPAVNGDAFSTSCVVDAGTYSLYVLAIQNTNCGKMDFAFDGGAAAGTIDFYAGSLTYNFITSISSISLSAGYHKLTGTINGKNASSSGYTFFITKVWLRQSSD